MYFYQKYKVQCGVENYWMKSDLESLLTHCRLSELSHTIYWKILISILGMTGYAI